MTDTERHQYADDPEMLALIQAIRTHEFQTLIMIDLITGTPERT